MVSSALNDARSVLVRMTNVCCSGEDLEGGLIGVGDCGV
jgi:hypothetical protein